MREIRLYGSEGGGAVCSPYPYHSTATSVQSRSIRNLPELHHKRRAAGPNRFEAQALVESQCPIVG
jgi:hypothetical protein